ncbi:glycosyltransferase family 2 protein [Pseudolysinimonas sp.]|uniref:glycosyltransferase family 2 protein n=1 Tax=Pseudolysinimonas sp. TaxID=2680009 RepID=UPI00286ABDDF|nr:glycosyltransferase family 2 protein [Pseudolysinimonas sp.]
MNAEVAVLIVSYNTRDRTLACVRSVLAHPPAAATEIVVVDNDSADGSADALDLEFPSVTVLRSGGNLGFARAVNLGARVTAAEYLLLLNPDTLVPSGSLAALLGFARAHPEHGVYGGRTFREDGELDPSSCWGAPTLWSLSCFALGLSTAFAGSAVFDPESLGRWQRDTVREVPIVTGCLLLVTRADFERIGGMDERFFLYGEDAEFSLRAARAGMRPVIVPEASIVHAVGASTGARGRKMTMVLAGKVTLLRSAWSPQRARIGVGMLGAGVLLRAGLETLTRRRDRMWAHAWRHRNAWLPGYPEARELIFGKEATHA